MLMYKNAYTHSISEYLYICVCVHILMYTPESLIYTVGKHPQPDFESKKKCRIMKNNQAIFLMPLSAITDVHSLLCKALSRSV